MQARKSKTITIPREIIESLEELAAEAEMSAFSGGERKDDVWLPGNPELAKLAGEVYRVLHWYAAPDCRKNHQSWKPKLELIHKKSGEWLAEKRPPENSSNPYRSEAFNWLEKLRMRLTGELPCGCHYHPTYKYVVMAGCPKHD